MTRLLLILLALALPARAAVVYDTIGDSGLISGGGGIVGTVNGVRYQQAMQFVLPLSAEVREIQIPLSRIVSGNAGAVVVELSRDAGGLPGNAIAAWVTSEISSTTPARIFFYGGINLLADEPYWLKVSAAPGSDFGGAWYFSWEPIDADEAWYRSDEDRWQTIHRRAYGLTIGGVLAGDANGDDRVNADDLVWADRQRAMASVSAPLAVVPEPGLAWGLAGLLMLRRRGVN